MVLAYNAMVIP